VEREIIRLGQIISKPDFDDWQEHTLPQQLKRLGTLIGEYPADAPPETLERLMALSKHLRDMDREYGIKFKEQYAEIRQKGSEIMGERVGLMKADISSFAERLKDRKFKDRSQAETYVSSSEALGVLRSAIAELEGQNPEAARELDRALKVQIANIMFEIEQGGLTTISETGQQMERFGNTLFPKWEGKVHEKTKRQFSLVFIADKKSMGPGVTPDKILGDIGIREINSRGKMQDTRLYEGMQDEDKYRLGSAISRKGDLFAPSYMTQAEFREIMKDYADWNKGDASNIRREFNGKIQGIKDWYKRKQEIGKTDGLTKEDWNKGYRELLSDYASFSAKKHILVFNRIDNLKKAPETAFANGKGVIEEWQNYWVRDPATEKYLEEMAQILKMQLEQQSGILTIRGNPGAGKDVLVSMFSSRTNMPYFATDCSKWDTPYEFSEDIVLESKDGASQTVHVPSTVLNGITTPGAIVYLNEIHALTEPAQIFLHALTDAKRRITLKTSSGKVVKALDSVALIASMNPQVKDPIEPALRDRMVFMDVDYPPLFREADPADSNKNPPIDASEALRIAREVKSLSDLTIESNMDRNEFVKMWDKYVNGIDNRADSPSKVQEFDINVILATVQFANRLRENFVAFKSGRTQTARGALPVSLPATGRPLRDGAYALSNIPDDQKITGNPEAVARTLLGRWFLSKIDNIEDRDKIKTAMETWTSSKRPAA
jgi:MoxR-like ATPase